ncbi:Uncharacterized protein PCOAH_00007990 [Plasmodium coatneyi]|uniref:Uncharacterized protein n=1 Tax=Plasmodium coatneyi TaxID=208452 RepID=A0A1B1DUB2_9APIC|nr:Uncharacterized protein PCOAH_00007990 [Plasmodium coatneyi]ANQ06386.1 Uncharacterized protein PCOAH_00007990 [Plasmodium coatneyi]
MIFSPFVLILLSLLPPQWKCHFCKFEKNQGKYLSPPVGKVRKDSRLFFRLHRKGSRDYHPWREQQGMSVCPLRGGIVCLQNERPNDCVWNRLRLNTLLCVRPFQRECASMCRSFDKRGKNNTTQWERYNKEKAQTMFIWSKTGFNFPKRKRGGRSDRASGGTISWNIGTRFEVHRKGKLLPWGGEKDRLQDSFAQITNDVNLPDGIPTVGESCNGFEMPRDRPSSSECTKTFLRNILQRSSIHNCTQNEGLFRMLKGINALLSKLHVSDYGKEDEGGGVLDTQSVSTNEGDAKSGEEQMINVHNLNRGTLSKRNYLNKTGDFSTTDKHNMSGEHTSASSSPPDVPTGKEFKTWGLPLNLMLIKSCVDKVVKSVCADDHAEREISKGSNIFVKCENVIQKRLFFHLVCLHTRMATWTGGRRRDVILYLYREDEEEAENFYSHLKGIYSEESVSFFNYKNCIHNDKTAFIILLSYYEFFNLTLHVANKTPADLEGYLNGKASYGSGCPNLFSLFSQLLVSEPHGVAAKCHEPQHNFKIFLDDFNVTYNYGQSAIEKNLYEHLFPAIDLRRGNVTFYPLLRTSFPTLWFKTWLEHVHKECCSVNLRKGKNVFILHKRFILPLLDGKETAQWSSSSSGRRGPKEIAQRDKAMINPSLYPLFDLATNKKRNFRTPQVEQYMSIFNKHRKEIIVEYLKRHNLYNINKLKRKDKKIKRKFNIARRFLKKKKKNLPDLEISHYINFFMNRKKKGSIFFRKNVIDYGYVAEREFLQGRDKIHILTKGLLSGWHCGDASYSGEPHNSVKQIDSSRKVGRQKVHCSKWEEDEKCDEEMNAPFFLQSRGETRLRFGIDTSLPNESKHFFYKSGDAQEGSSQSTARVVAPLYPCIYYRFDKDTFEKFSKEVYAGLPFLPERFRRKWRSVLKKYEQEIRPSFSFKKYLRKGLFLVREKLSKLEKQFIGELLKNDLIKIILSCVDISSDAIGVNTVFVEDVQVYVKDKLPQYNRLLNLINGLHGEVIKHPSCGSSSYGEEGPPGDDLYRLHFVKYFLYLNWAKIFRKYTLSNNDLLNLCANSTNCFLIPRRYEDISILLNLQNEGYLNISHLHKTLLRDFYFNLYSSSISRGISFLLNGAGEWQINSSPMFDDQVSSAPEGEKSYRFFYTQRRWGQDQVEGLSPHNIIHMAIKTAQGVHKIYKYKETNETILVDRFLGMSNETAYSINYFDFLYFHFLTNKNIGTVKRQLINNVFEFYAVQRKEWEKVFVTSDREDKMNDYLERVQEIKKYFPEDYAYVYYDTFVKYNNVRKEVRKKLRNIYRQKYSMLRESICEGDQTDVVLTTVDEERCIILDVYKMNPSMGEKKKKQKSDLYVCANSKGDLFICNIFFFDRVLKDKEMCDFIRERNKGINYVDFLFGQRDVVNYELLFNERHFPFDIHLGDCKNCADGKDNKCHPTDGEKKKKKKIFHQFVVNKIRINETSGSQKKCNNNKEEQISQPHGEETKMVNVEDLFKNWYSENLYSRRRRLSLYWKKLMTLKREMLNQCASRLNKDMGKNAHIGCVEEDHYNKAERHPVEEKKKPVTYEVNRFSEGATTSCVTRNGHCQSSENKIMSAKIMGTLKKYKKKKNSGNRNNYTKEMNKVDRIFGNKRKTIMDEFRNMLSFLQHLDLIDTLRKFLNPYVRNSLWFYVITLYLNQQYEIDPGKFLVQPERVIIIFYICFCKGKGDYLGNYLASFQVDNDGLRDVVVDVFAYKQLLCCVQDRFQINVEIPFNLEGVQNVYDGLIKLREKKYTEMDLEVKAKLSKLSTIVQVCISNNFNQGVNQILLNFVRSVDHMRTITQVM